MLLEQWLRVCQCFLHSNAALPNAVSVASFKQALIQLMIDQDLDKR